MTVVEVLDRVRELGDDLVLVTGGEPLLQPAVHELMTRLLDSGTRVLLETGGHRSLESVDPRAEIIMDIKCPGSGEERHNDWRNLEFLKPTDQVKLVIANRRDFDWCRAALREHQLTGRCHVIVSPVHGELSGEQLATWILESGLDVRLGLQVHKLIWSPERRGV
jgi:7-carboxy-7-deazaguanine synthase